MRIASEPDTNRAGDDWKRIDGFQLHTFQGFSPELETLSTNDGNVFFRLITDGFSREGDSLRADAASSILFIPISASVKPFKAILWLESPSQSGSKFKVSVGHYNTINLIDGVIETKPWSFDFNDAKLAQAKEIGGALFKFQWQNNEEVRITRLDLAPLTVSEQ